MAEFPDDAEDFKADLVKLGVRILSAGGIAQVVGYSESHVRNLLGGSKRYTPGARTRLGEMIAAKANGPGEQMITKISELPPIPESELISDATQGVGTEWIKRQVDPRIYKIFRDPDGRAVVTKVLARFTSTADADEYVLFLNSQIRHGKEAG